MIRVVQILAFAVLALLAGEAYGGALDSKEFKAMLKVANFNGSVSTVLSQLANLKSALVSAATASGRTSSGSFSLKSGMPRTVKFYDTPNCHINSKGYAFRMRRLTGATNWEGTLKYRDLSYAVADNRRTDMNHCATKDLGGKFEGDLSLGGSTYNSYSYKCEISNGKNINILDDVDDTWDEISNVWWNEFGWDKNTNIYQVAGLTITERVYEGFVVSFPGTQASFAVTLWYTSSSSTTPVLAELSFTTDGDNDSNVDAFYSSLPSKLSAWLDTAALFKTAWLYSKTSC